MTSEFRTRARRLRNAVEPVAAGIYFAPVAHVAYEAMWRFADLVREHRGDSHVISWAAGGADAVEVLLLTEQWWGLPARSCAPIRRWQSPDMDVGFARLERPLLDALGDDLDELLGYLDVWSDAIIEGGSYPQRIVGVYNVGGGPHFGACLTIDTAAEYLEK